MHMYLRIHPSLEIQVKQKKAHFHCLAGYRGALKIGFSFPAYSSGVPSDSVNLKRILAEQGIINWLVFLYGRKAPDLL